VRRKLLTFVLAVLAALATAGIAAAGNGGLAPVQPASPNAHHIVTAYWVIVAFTAAIFFLVEGLLVVFIWKYRSRGRPRTVEGPQVHGHARLEIIWTVIPVLILAAIGTFVFWELPGIADAPKAAAADETTVNIEGHQFYWLFRYPNGAISIDRMVAPADEVVHENVIGMPFDVNHSWWVPDFGGKMDAIPGRVNHTWFQAPSGDYVARCAELCGIQHAHMDGVVHVVPRAQYDDFIRARAADPTGTGLGQEEWTGVCEKCHRLDHVYIGPALGGNPLLANREGIETLLRNGQGNMPAVGKNWTDAQIDALISYTKQFAKTGTGS